MLKPSYENMEVNWNYSPLIHKHHGEHEVSNERLCTCVHVWQLHAVFTDLPGLPVPSTSEKGAFLKALLSSALKQISKHE